MKELTAKTYAEKLESAFLSNQALLENPQSQLEVRSRVETMMEGDAYRLELVLHYTVTFPKIEIETGYSLIDNLSVTTDTNIQSNERVHFILSESGSLLASLKNQFEKAFRLSTLSGAIVGQAEQYTTDDALPNYLMLWEVNNDKDLITSSKHYFLIDRSGSAQRFKSLMRPVYRTLNKLSTEDFSRKDLNEWIDNGQSPNWIQQVQTYHPVPFLMRQAIPAIEWTSEQLSALANTIEYAHVDPAFWKRSDSDYQNSIEQGFKQLATRLKTYQIELNQSFVKVQIAINHPNTEGTLTTLALESFEKIYADYKSDMISLIEKLRHAIDQIIGLLLDTMDDLIEHLAAYIAFLCGLWDAFVDAFSGIFHFLSFGFLHLKAWVKTIADPESAVDFLTELVDEFIQSIKSLIEKFFEGTLDKLLSDVFSEVSAWMALQYDDIMHELGKSGVEGSYYYGYFIYDVIELAFPPLKLTRSASVATKVQKALSKVHPKLYDVVKDIVI